MSPTTGTIDNVRKLASVVKQHDLNFGNVPGTMWARVKNETGFVPSFAVLSRAALWTEAQRFRKSVWSWLNAGDVSAGRAAGDASAGDPSSGNPDNGGKRQCVAVPVGYTTTVSPNCRVWVWTAQGLYKRTGHGVEFMVRCRNLTVDR